MKSFPLARRSSRPAAPPPLIAVVREEVAARTALCESVRNDHVILARGSPVLAARARTWNLVSAALPPAFFLAGMSVGSGAVIRSCSRYVMLPRVRPELRWLQKILRCAARALEESFSGFARPVSAL